MKRIVGLSLIILILVISMVGCSSKGSSNKNGSGNKNTRVIKFISEDTPKEQEAKIFTEMDEEFPDTKLEIETIEQNNILQQISLLSASNDLPELFKYESNQLGDLIDNGQVLDMEKTFKELGIYEELSPSAVDLLKQLSGDRGLYALPVELNIEGFWYNKQLFEENNLEVPETWAELIAVSDKLIEAGVQPFSVAGKERWPITRLINGYVIRYYGVDAMEKVSNGDLSVTDKGFIEAAKTIQEMGEKGFFGKGVNTIDGGTALDVFLQGGAAMYYSGSWDVANFNNEERNQVGIDNIGLFNVPLVEGGKGKMSDWSMNAGLTLSASADKYDEQMAEWMKNVFTNYGDTAMADQGMVSGFTVDQMPEDISPLTKITLETIDEAENAALWFEGRFNPDEKLVAEQNAQLLVTGDITPEVYMELLDTEIQKSKK